MKESQATVYTAFSECLKEPSANWRKEMPRITAFLDAAEIAGALANAPDLPAEYARSFLFPVDTRVVPVESVYRLWTQDSSATLSFAHSKGYLMADAAFHMKHLYELYELTPPLEFSPVPDHLCLELEFAALLLQRGELEKYELFLREHLDWVGELAAEAAEKEIPMFYRLLLKKLAGFLACEAKARV